jgi:hypothetical protein
MRCPCWLTPRPPHAVLRLRGLDATQLVLRDRDMDRSIGVLSNNNGTRIQRRDNYASAAAPRPIERPYALIIATEGKRGCNGVVGLFCRPCGSKSVPPSLIGIKHALIISGSSASRRRPCPALGPTSHSAVFDFSIDQSRRCWRSAQEINSFVQYAIHSTVRSALATLTICALGGPRGRTEIFVRKLETV